MTELRYSCLGGWALGWRELGWARSVGAKIRGIVRLECRALNIAWAGWMLARTGVRGSGVIIDGRC